MEHKKTFEKCIVIPCFNEGQRIDVAQFIDFARKNGGIKLCFVNDGSKDNTRAVLEQYFSGSQFKILNLETNVGKADAVRQGVLGNLDCGIIGYFDADLSTPLEEFIRLSELLTHETRFVFGSRILTVNSNIVRSPFRHYSGRMIATFISIILRLPIYDTQCGAKVFSNEIAQIAFKDTFISRWLFDVEILARLITHFGYQKLKNVIREEPLKQWIEAGESKITFLDMLRIPFHLFRIKIHYKL